MYNNTERILCRKTTNSASKNYRPTMGCNHCAGGRMRENAPLASVTRDHTVLVRRIAAGDPQAEIELIETFMPGIKALVRRHARPQDPVVDDLVQEVLQRLIQRLRAAALKEPKALPAYIRSTAVNTVVAEYRRRGRRGEYSANQDIDRLPSPDQPHQQVQRDLLKKSISTLLSELPVERDREILRLFYLRDNDRDAVCTALGIDTKHFRRVLYRARQRLKVLLQRSGIGETK